MVGQIHLLIEAKDIREITFVLSADNRIVMDALGNQNFANVYGLGDFYHILTKQKGRLKRQWKLSDLRISLLSYYLNTRIKELQPKLSKRLAGQIEINAKIYKKQGEAFHDTYLDLIARKCISLN